MNLEACPVFLYTFLGSYEQNRGVMKTFRGIFTLVLVVCVSLCSAQEEDPSIKEQQDEIRFFFSGMKIALVTDRLDAVISYTSSNVLDLVEAAREVGLDPDSVTEAAPSQYAVNLGLVLLLRLGSQQLESMDAEELFEWSARNGAIPLRGFAVIDLRDIRIDGNHAVASIDSNLGVSTNHFVSFELDDGEWKLDLARMLLSGEDLFRKAREERNVTKIKLAVLSLERAYGRQLPSLRELFLSREVRSKVAVLKDANPSDAYQSIISELSAGRQKDAEGMLEVLVNLHPDDQRLAFAQAVCARSRFRKRKAGTLFRHVLNMDPGTVEGKCARHALDLEKMKRVDENFAALKRLANENPDNPFLLWVIGIYCRTYNRNTDKTDRSADGVEAYTKLLELFEVGPVLLHQTFANILAEELDRPEEALKHRRIAVELQPRAWSYDGLANTLTALKKYDEANEIYAEVTRMKPNDARKWHNWAMCLRDQEKWADCAEKCRKAIKCDPGYYQVRSTWGYALNKQGKLEEALEQYEENIRMDPVNPYPYKEAAKVYRKLGQPEKSEETLDKLAAVTGKPRTKKPRRQRFAIAPVIISPNSVTMNVSSEQSFAICHGLEPYAVTITDPQLGRVAPGPTVTNDVFGVHYTYTYHPATAQRGAVATNYVLVYDAGSNSARAKIVQWR